MKPANYGPIYAACMYPELAESFRAKGWALAVHGSLERDFDLIAVPWHNKPVPAERCVELICHYHSLKLVGEPVERLHGRLVFTLALEGGFGECFLDLSFMPVTET